jgi:hypothetical protein
LFQQNHCQYWSQYYRYRRHLFHLYQLRLDMEMSQMYKPHRRHLRRNKLKRLNKNFEGLRRLNLPHLNLHRLRCHQRHPRHRRRLPEKDCLQKYHYHLHNLDLQEMHLRPCGLQLHNHRRRLSRPMLPYYSSRMHLARRLLK